MTLRLKLLATAAGSFLAGVLLTGAAAKYSFSKYMQAVWDGHYYAHAVEAQWAAHELSLQRAGETDKLVHDLELMLDANTIQFAEYEEFVPPQARDPNVYRLLADVRSYRAQFPAHYDSPHQQARYQKALDLGKRAGE